MKQKKWGMVFFLTVLISVFWAIPASAESGRFQSAYHVEFGKKLLAEGKPERAAEEFSVALYFDVGNLTARDQLERTIRSSPSAVTRTTLQQQHFLELTDYVNFLNQRLADLTKENKALRDFVAARQNAAGAKPLGAAVPSEVPVLPVPLEEFNIAVLDDALNTHKNLLLKAIREADALNAQLRVLKYQVCRIGRGQAETSQAKSLVAHIKDLQLSTARKDEIIEQQSKNIALLNDELNLMRRQFAGLQTKFGEAEARITDMSTNLAGSSLEIYQRDQRLTEKEAQLAELRTELSELQERSGLMQRIIQEKSMGPVMDASEDHAARLQILEQQFQDLNGKYAVLAKNLSAKEEEIARLNQEVAVREEKLANLKNAFFNKEKRVDELLGVLEIYKSKLGETLKGIDGVDMPVRPERSLSDDRAQGIMPPLRSSSLSMEIKTPYSLRNVLEQLSGDLQAMKQETR